MQVGPDGEPIDPIEPRRTAHDVPADPTAPPPPPAHASAPLSSPGALPLSAHEPAPAPPRPVVQLDPVARRRHRNMLGALLVGTLQVGVGSRHAAGAPPQPLCLPAPFLPITVFPQRAREEEERDAELLARRAMIQQKAEQRVAEQSERLKEQERERILQQRKRDLVLRARLMAKAEEKEVHLLARHWHRHRSLLSHFIRTQASPPIMYLPARPSPPTDKLLQAQAQSLEEWQQNQERKVQQLVADSLQRHLAEADRLMLPQGGEEGQARMDSVVDEEEERDERKEGTSEVRVKEEKVAAPDGELLKEEGVDGEGKGKGLEGESSGVRQQHAEEASGGTGGAREEGLRDKYKGDEGKEEEGVEERGEEVRRERRARGDKGREEEGEGREKGGEGREKGGEGREKGGEGREKGGEGREKGGEGREKGGEGREKGGEGREKGGEGREKGGEGREKGGEGREKGGEGRRRSRERRSPGRRVPRTRSPHSCSPHSRSPHSRSPQRRSSQGKGTERRSGGSPSGPSSSSSGGREAARHRG
ncbi:unnamed protein product [Closterium sp. NIES-65]|nr:unnamed protein product [Closterium sp. NIES-65]